MFSDAQRFACNTQFPIQRIKRLIAQAIDRYGLDLSGLTVLTEAASGYYRTTPVIASMANAQHVLALARDSSFGTVEQVREQVMYLAEQLHVANAIKVTTTRNAEVFGTADIVTNLGAVRPIDQQVIQHLKPSAVVSLMFGGNDWRPHELDLTACWQRDIAVAGVDEVAIDLFRFTGMRMVWFLLELGIEVVGCRLVFMGTGPVMGKVMDFFKRMGTDIAAITTETGSWTQRHGGIKIADQIDNPAARCALAEADALFTFDPLRKRKFIGQDGSVTARELAQIAPAISVINYSGFVDRSSLHAHGINCFPRVDPGDGHSANTIGEILPAPVIELHTAGLKVGELMARARLANLSANEAEDAAVDSGWGENLRHWPILRARNQKHHVPSSSGS